MDIKEIVDKLIGSCSPQGCATRDKNALLNLVSKINLVQELIFDIEYIATYKNSHEASVKTIGERADKFLSDYLINDKSYEKCEKVTNEMVNWALDNIGNPDPKSGEKFDEIWNKY